MHRRKLEQIRTYSRIMKHKKTTGEVEEVRLGGTGLGRNTIGRE